MVHGRIPSDGSLIPFPVLFGAMGNTALRNRHSSTRSSPCPRHVSTHIEEDGTPARRSRIPFSEEVTNIPPLAQPQVEAGEAIVGEATTPPLQRSRSQFLRLQLIQLINDLHSSLVEANTHEGAEEEEEEEEEDGEEEEEEEEEEEGEEEEDKRTVETQMRTNRTNRTNRTRHTNERHADVSTLLRLLMEVSSRTHDVGASQSQINNLPVWKFHPSTKSVETPQCSVCLMELEEEDEVRTLPCFHFFHRECIDKWLRGNNTCPVCKFPITQTSSG